MLFVRSFNATIYCLFTWLQITWQTFPSPSPRSVQFVFSRHKQFVREDKLLLELHPPTLVTSCSGSGVADKFYLVSLGITTKYHFHESRSVNDYWSRCFVSIFHWFLTDQTVLWVDLVLLILTDTLYHPAGYYSWATMWYLSGFPPEQWETVIRIRSGAMEPLWLFIILRSEVRRWPVEEWWVEDGDLWYRSHHPTTQRELRSSHWSWVISHQEVLLGLGQGQILDTSQSEECVLSKNNWTELKSVMWYEIKISGYAFFCSSSFC